MSLQTNYSMYYRVVHSEMRKMDLQVIKKVCVVTFYLYHLYSILVSLGGLQKGHKKINEIVFFMIHHTLNGQGH